MKFYSSWVPPEYKCQFLRDNNIGIVLTPKAARRPVPGLSWFLDNGAFQAWRRKYPFPEYGFINALREIPIGHKPDFIVTPDIVAGGKKSLDFSISWMDKIATELNGNYISQYIAVQDGMTENDVFDLLPKMNYHVGGLFIGGTMDWKIETAEVWIKFAYKRNWKVHIGRIPTLYLIGWAIDVGADSVDSGSWFGLTSKNPEKFIEIISNHNLAMIK